MRPIRHVLGTPSSIGYRNTIRQFHCDPADETRSTDEKSLTFLTLLEGTRFISIPVDKLSSEQEFQV